MKYQLAPRVLVLFVSVSFGASDALAQASVPGTDRRRNPQASTLGPAIGDSGQSADAPGSQESVLGGRAGTSAPRIVPGAVQPGGVGRRPRPEISPVAPLSGTDVPVFGPLSLPTREDEGPADGLTLDSAIDQLVRVNPDLLAKSLEIPQARADVLTASLRANPILFADSQLIPYGNFSENRPGGATQYDLNITWPLDVTGKRRARTVVAHRAVHVVEAQYQDAVRQQINNLYTAFVDALAARETVRYSKAAVEGLAQVEELARARLRAKDTTPGEVNRMVIQREAATVELNQAEEAQREANRVLGTLLDIPPATAENMEIRGKLTDRSSPPPGIDALVGIALRERPDLNAYRLGVRRAEADVSLAHAERFSDVYLLAQPYTFQNNAPFDKKSAHSWAVGVTVPLPLFNRNQGNIARARINVVQTQRELIALERQVMAEVRKAERQYAVTRASVEKVEKEMLPAASQVLEESLRLYRGGEADFVAYLNARRDYNEAVRLYLDSLIRHRRSMLSLNTAIGRRILP